MIYAFTGKTGSGKTYEMVRQAFKLWRHGVDIYSNTVLLFSEFGGQPNCTIFDSPSSFTYFERYKFYIIFYIKRAFKKDAEIPRRGNIRYFQDITEILEVRDGIILIDEGQELLEARNWENLPYEFSNKLRQHRKHRLDLYITTQNLGTIDINYRRLVQIWYHMEDVFALFAKRNPSLLSLHKRHFKDIDELYNTVDDLQVTNLKTNLFIIHFRKKRLYDTLYDIGFNRYKIVWLENMHKDKGKSCLIMPKRWSLSQGRTQLLLQKYYLDRNKSNPSKSGSKSYARSF